MDYEQRLKDVSDEILNSISYEEPEQPTPEMVRTEPGDMYRNQYNARVNANKAQFPYGGNARINADVSAVLTPLKGAYNKAKDDSDILKSRGDFTRAEMVKQQYIEEHLLPAIETVVNLNTPDEVINSQRALSELDNYANLGNMSGSGFTKAYIKSMFAGDRGQDEQWSDNYVKSELERIKRIMANDNIRSGTGLANKLKSKIDNGENIASQADYELLQKITLR